MGRQKKQSLFPSWDCHDRDSVAQLTPSIRNDGASMTDKQQMWTTSLSKVSRRPNSAEKAVRSSTLGTTQFLKWSHRPKKQAQSGIEDFDEELKSSVTQVHVTTLDEVVSVNSSFCVAVFIGLSFSPNPNAIAPLAPADPHCQAGLDTYRYLLIFEVLSFRCFLFSSLIAHGIKLYIVLGNGQDPQNVKSASVNNRLLRLGILLAAMRSAVGSIFLTLSLVNIVQIKLGSFTCGSVWTHRTTIPLVLVSTGVAIFTSSVFLAFRR